MSTQQAEWHQALIEKYNYAGPRYTSYPTALSFQERFSEADYLHAVEQYPERNLSLYVHIPFCHQLCYFCGCNKQVTRQPQKADRYLEALTLEIRQRAPMFQGRRVTQLHLGGGTPTFLTKNQLSRLIEQLRRQFSFSADIEMSIEIDPRELASGMIEHLWLLGFTRLSIGIQDFDPAVQQRINRIQDESSIEQLMREARSVGFRSVSFDLIYGLPLQTPESFAATLAKVISLAPDRLSVFNYAHLPELFAAQRKIKSHELPSAGQKLVILQQSIATLTAAGYCYIGMDHFALPQDELAVAQREGRLHRNFQGYTTQGECDLLGLGVSAISSLGESHAQNHKVLNTWYSCLENQGSGLWRGVTLNDDDCLRRDVIKQLICHFRLDFSAIEARWPIDFCRYFAEDLALLAPLVADGLVTLDDEGLKVTSAGRLLIRNICMCFDRYARRTAQLQQCSRVI
ncbi:oxygen-independent coproporphyrinogen III oxidase [Pantoea sp. A4]|uniref:oxygen-independent coproporphyrinogen III oxidase n=1 Tax=Pantoea sp. A4 TaxID=1225184 RepID=UPI00036D9305|nr:oxygen-independent coproporphyrinogen III oxidase [Pantoea sp. A4]